DNAPKRWRIRPTKLFAEFFESEKAGGLILVACTLVSLLLANSAWGETYQHGWHSNLGGFPLEFWINDGLMTIFFLLIGLEIEREVYIGELSNWRNALLPIVAALGGMVVPAAFHYVFNHGTPTQVGIGVPMATDIAFSLGILSLLGSRVPLSLKVFLTALAIIDDMGAIVLIALFYSKGISVAYLGAAALLFALMLALNRLKMYRIWVYLVLGALMWYCMHHSGIHATITGILLAFAIPFGKGDELSPSYRLQHVLHKPVAFIILPLFALANTGIAIPHNWAEGLFSDNSMGIVAGLVLGKPLGILCFTLGAVAAGICTLPQELNRRMLLGAGFLAGIGFTMSVFITLLAFNDAGHIVESKIAVFIASLVAGLLGYAFLSLVLPPGLQEKD
ncbi:MAG: Na+/H+ antiporter NhaA, partial [Saprospiraceae bacterium]|nr:Na+/H+ antiporter NhaA [Saprospiraceae bacterium]